MASVVFFLADASSSIVPLDDAETITIGRHPDSRVVLQNPSVSSRHATIKHREKGFYVQDLGSSNGTRLNGAEIEEALLSDGDRISFGDMQAVFYAGDAPAVIEEDVPAAKSSFVPRPSVAPVPSADAPPVPVRARGARKVSANRVPSGYPDQSGGGCATAMFLTGLFIVAFFIGLSMRHYQETERSLFGDMVSRITRNLPKVKIEKE